MPIRVIRGLFCLVLLKGVGLHFLQFWRHRADIALWNDLMASFFGTMAHFNGLMAVSFAMMAAFRGLMDADGGLMFLPDGSMAATFRLMWDSGGSIGRGRGAVLGP